MLNASPWLCSASVTALLPPTTPMVVVSLPLLIATWKPSMPTMSTMRTAEPIRNPLSRIRVETSRPATSRTWVAGLLARVAGAGGREVAADGDGVCCTDAVMPPPPRGSR